MGFWVEGTLNVTYNWGPLGWNIIPFGQPSWLMACQGSQCAYHGAFAHRVRDASMNSRVKQWSSEQWNIFWLFRVYMGLYTRMCNDPLWGSYLKQPVYTSIMESDSLVCAIGYCYEFSADLSCKALKIPREDNPKQWLQVWEFHMANCFGSRVPQMKKPNEQVA